ncbi:hypothetical protein OPV22_007025 [Ensete ventricosum]|uniref:Uncharacterized protein n=1 Tax=Ensete ventricosum TaxID=4639 RepID=A0AAV8RPC7_ENSVE|nr:hypothetical protein OPV22_007025 [Ensete ventricosum]
MARGARHPRPETSKADPGGPPHLLRRPAGAPRARLLLPPRGFQGRPRGPREMNSRRQGSHGRKYSRGTRGPFSITTSCIVASSADIDFGLISPSYLLKREWQGRCQEEVGWKNWRNIN